MYGSLLHGSALWWIFPLLMIVLCIVMCGFMMRGRMGVMRCWPGSGSTGRPGGDTAGSAMNILDRRYVQGEINKEEYEEKKEGIGRNS